MIYLVPLLHCVCKLLYILEIVVSSEFGSVFLCVHFERLENCVCYVQMHGAAAES